MRLEVATVDPSSLRLSISNSSSVLVLGCDTKSNSGRVLSQSLCVTPKSKFRYHAEQRAPREPGGAADYRIDCCESR